METRQEKLQFYGIDIVTLMQQFVSWIKVGLQDLEVCLKDLVSRHSMCSNNNHTKRAVSIVWSRG